MLNLYLKVSQLKCVCVGSGPDASTCSDDGSIVHEDHHVCLLHKLDAMSAKDSGLPPEQLHHTFLHKMFSHVGIDSSQRIIQEVDILVLSSDQKDNAWSHI